MKNDIKSRVAAVRFVEKQLADGTFMKGTCAHYGKEALRQLLDYIYGGVPKSEHEKLLTSNIDARRDWMAIKGSDIVEDVEL